MRLLRKLDRSIYFWLDDLVPSVVTVTDGFPAGELVLPTVSITSLDVRGYDLELGACQRDLHFWRIDIFSENEAQRDELAAIIYEELENNITVYNYDEGFPPSVAPSVIGKLLILQRRIHPIHVFTDLVDKFYWRKAITFSTKYEPGGD